MDTPNWVSFFEDSRNYSERRRIFRISECTTGSTNFYQPDLTLKESSNSRRLSHESLSRRPLPALPGEKAQSSKYNRPLPPTPTLSFDKSNEIRQKILNNNKQIEKTHHDGLHTRRKKRRTQNPSSNKTSKGNMAVTETSVTLTLSVRNGSDAKKLQQEYINNNYASLQSLKRPVTVQQSFSRTESEKSRTELVKTIPRSKRKRNACIIPMVIMTVIIMTGLLTAVSVILLRPLDEEKSIIEEGHDMVVGHVRMRLLNRQFHKHMLINNSKHFTNIEIPLCVEMDGMFLFSNYTSSYYGCDVTMLRSGSVRVLQELLFKDSKELRDPFSIRNIIQSSSGVFDWYGLKAINIGDFVVDYGSINVNIDIKRIPTLPRKPHFQDKGIVLEKATSLPQTTAQQYSVVRNNTSTSSTTLPSTTTRKFIAVPITSTVTNAADKETSTSPTTAKHEVKTVTNIYSEDSVLVTPVSSSTTTEAHLYETTSELQPQSTFDTEGTLGKKVQVNPSTPTATATNAPRLTLTNSGSQNPGTSVAVQCSLHALQEWTHITVTHYRPGQNPKVVFNVTRDGSTDFPVERYANRLIVDLKLRRRSASVSMNFTKIDCSDEGTYLCTAFSPMKLVTGKGYLHVKAKPSNPVLTLPVEIIEDREMTTPIVCKANSGYPPGRLRWLIKPRGQTRFIPIPLDVSEVEKSGKCNNIITGRFYYTPSLDGNGTSLKCLIENDYVPLTTEYSSTKVLNVVPAGYCDNVDDGSVLRHPYECNKYITCVNYTFHVETCKDELCFNPNTRTCGQTGLSMANVVAYMNEGVTSLSCRLLHPGSWKTVTVWKVQSDGTRLKILVVSDRKNITYPDSGAKGRIFADIQTTKHEVYIKLWIYKLACEDEGVYICSADTPIIVPEAYGKIQLKVKPSLPVITTPTEVIVGRQMREAFVCKGSVGYPHGRVFWQVKFKGQKQFTNSTFNETVSEETHECSRTMKKEIKFIPSMKHESMELKCVVENDETLPEGQVLWSSVQVHVIPANFCSPSHTGPIPHPHDCRQYVQCSEGYIYVQKCSLGLCFNPDTFECDLPEPMPEVVFNPEFPCKPNKNGVYFPHSYLCNKYVWCVQGREKIQHCPLGTLYLANGQCTFNTEQSHCYRTTTTAIT